MTSGPSAGPAATASNSMPLVLKVVITGSNNEGSYTDFIYQVQDAEGNPVGGPNYHVAEQISGDDNIDNNNACPRSVGRDGACSYTLACVPQAGYRLPT